MDSNIKEITPVIYNSAAVKIIKFETTKENPLCFRMHWHERMEILRIREGKIRLDFGTAEEIYESGDIVIIRPNQLHKGTLVGKQVKYDTLMFDVRSFYNDTDICKKYLPPVFDGRTRFLNHTNNKDIVKCVDSIIENSAFNERAFLVTSNIYLLFSLLYEHCVLESHTYNPLDQSICEIIDFIESNYALDLTTKFLSEHFKYSKPYFCKKFKNSTGLSPMNYLKIFRIEKAYRLFKDGETDVSDIALKCGFTDPNYFTRCFKAHFGYPPSHYIIKNK